MPFRKSNDLHSLQLKFSILLLHLSRMIALKAGLPFGKPSISHQAVSMAGLHTRGEKSGRSMGE
jgi:hypothetical protein